MNTMWLTFPVVMSLLTAVIAFGMRHQRKHINILSLSCALFVLLSSLMLFGQVYKDGIQSVFLGSWIAPFGIVFVADLLSVMLVVVTAIIGLMVIVYAMADLQYKASYGLYHVFFHILLAGVYGAFLTGDIFNLYVWFEVMLIASFGLMVIDADKKQINGAIKYVSLNLISTLVLLLAIGLLYGSTGTLNFADLHYKTLNIELDVKAMLIIMLLFSFAIKSAVFPLFFWLPDTYPGLPSATASLFAGLLTKVGVYVLVRIFTLIFPLQSSGWQVVLIFIAGMTMLTGVLGAACQKSIKNILSFHIISQIGYMIMGLAIYTPLALAGAIFYIIHHIIVKANLFLIGGVIERKYGSDRLNAVGGVYKDMPLLAFTFIIPAFSLAGFPPLSGFWGKFMVIKSSLLSTHYILATVALLVGLLTIFSMTKIWSEIFWKKSPETQSPVIISKVDYILYMTPIASLAILTLVIGFSAEFFFQLAMASAEQLLNSDEYIRAVLGR
ncbi:Na+/H+ antiporter subunit D [Aeromonas australiensis]|uniref:proton-conducting transporter transmembrane domain-containing protein n=1 Tax=Aeromonas australiensis TaxID=1114880 RepID=UPI001F478951|nr:proton-conducting transporter membrane subunit [Aeromonas australiensis]MCF3098746.1 Na+/H+ antiporter subunit D [Aeromonas australiensis]